MMPAATTDRDEIRRRLNQDRDWALYALADLDDGMFEHCDWWICGEGLALVFRALRIRPMVVMGDAAVTRALLLAADVPSCYLNLKPEQLPGAEGVYAYREKHEMLRMMLDEFRPREGATELLGPDQQGEVAALYGSAPGSAIAFAAEQLQSGFFRGIRRRGELVAVAGIHVFSRNESVAGVGNIFTRADCRGEGLAQVVTSAVAKDLVERGIRTIGLNVESNNPAAIAAYKHIGFRVRFTYQEGVAERVAL